MIKYVVLFAFLLMSFSFAQSKLISHSPRQIVVEFELPPITSQTVSIEERDYTHITYSDAQSFVQPGAPIVPYTLTHVAIPPGATITSQYQIIAQNELSQVDVVPATIINGMKENNRTPIDLQIYNSAAPYPGEIIEVSEPYIFRQMQMVDIKIYPVQYQPAQHQVRLLNKIAIQISIKGGQSGGGVYHLSEIGRDLLKNRVINFEQARDWVIATRGLQKPASANYDFSIGNWYKIPVREEGVYKLTGQFLNDQGISISDIDAAMIQMFNYGGAPLSTNVNRPRPADLNEVAIEVEDINGNGILDADDAIYFYGRSVTGWNYNSVNNRWENYLNPYSFTNYYIFTYNQNIGKRIPTVDSPQSGSAASPTSFIDRRRFEEESYNILASGLDWYWLKFQGTSAEGNIDFQMPQNILPDSQFISARFKGGSGSHYWEPNTFHYSVGMYINNQSIGSIPNFSNASSMLVTNRGINSLIGGNNHLRIQYGGDQEGCYAYFDYFELVFKRRFVAENNYLKFYYTVSTAPKEFNITGLPGGAHRVWDISDFANVISINPLQNGSNIRFQAVESAANGKQYFVFSSQAIKSVGQISEIENTPNLRDPARKGTLLIITSDDFYDAAEEWETFKETLYLNPIQAQRVKLSEIYREFSSGVADPTAIRDFIKYAYENWSEPPEYVQLLGDGSYDYRNIELPNYVNQVPVFEITADNDISSRATDNFFTSLNNASDGLTNLDPVLAVARMPANSIGDIRNYIRKMRAYSESYNNNANDNGWQTILTFVADDQCRGANSCNEWFHLEQTENIVSIVPKKFDLKKIYLVDYDTQAGGLGRYKPKANSDLIDQVNRGTLMINFFGHGDPNTWAHEQVLSKPRDLPLMHNGIKLPVWIAATCTWGKYDDPNIPSMGEGVIWAESGGIASIAASRPSFAFQNEVFARNVYTNLFRNGNDNMRSRILGTAVQMSTGGTTNDQKYHIFGDVSLQLADPLHVVKIESISSDTLKALSTVTVGGRVYDSENNFLSNFNGKALIRVYDAVDSLTHPEINYYYTYLGGTIFKGIVSVQNGVIEGSFIVPKSIKYKNSHTGRVSIYAWSENMQDAVGYNDTLLFNGTVSLSDTKGPDIKFTFPDQPDFFDGDYVSSQPTIRVVLQDDNGINLTGETGHRIELIIDSNVKKDVTEFFVYKEDSYTEGQLEYTLPALSSGRHELRISAWDNLNNISEQTVSFTTSAASELTLAQVVNYPNPFTADTRFTFQYQSSTSNGVGDVKIKIYTVTGRLIQELEAIATPGFNQIYWDGRDRNGDVLANGVYLYKIIIDDGGRTVEKIEKLAIVR